MVPSLGTTSDPVVGGHKAREKCRGGKDKWVQKAMVRLVGSAMAQPPQPVALDVPLPPDPNVGALLDAQQSEAQHAVADAVQSVTAAQQ